MRISRSGSLHVKRIAAVAAAAAEETIKNWPQQPQKLKAHILQQ